MRLCRRTLGVFAAVAFVATDVRAQNNKSDSTLVTDIVSAAPISTTPSIGDMLYFPIVFGFRVPSYTRSDGFVLPWGPEFALPNDELVIDPTITYRSHLGHFDPAISVVGEPDPSIDLDLVAQRTTASNDRWSNSDLVNSASVGLTGEDGFNYYRADRLEQRVVWHTASPTAATILSGYAGARWEFDHSVGPQLGTTREVWTILNHGDTTQILRPNPLIDRGHIGSGIAGGSLEWDSGREATATAALDLEAPWTTPQGAHFTQVTFDGHTTLPTVGAQYITFDTHEVITLGDTAPTQRYAYVGGSNTLPTRQMLDESGDELVYGSFLYVVPLPAPSLPLLGTPSVALHYAIGAAGVHRLPTLTQNVGPRLMWFIFRAEYLMDPVTHRSVFSVGATLNGSALDQL